MNRELHVSAALRPASAGSPSAGAGAAVRRGAAGTVRGVQPCRVPEGPRTPQKGGGHWKINSGAASPRL